MTEVYGRELTLMATNTHATGEKLLKRYPFFDSGVYERRMMFGRGVGALPTTPLTILPSARLVADGKITGAIAGRDY